MRETYTVGYGETTQRWTGARTAANSAGFLLPHLRPDMRVLDCGCGPGSITLGLAGVVAPGVVVGVDVAPWQLARARALAKQEGVKSLAFAAGDAYRLPFSDASFDAVLAHMLLGNLRDPPAALRELRRVLRPGGVIGVRDSDWGGWVMEPSTPLLEEYRALFLRALIENGASPFHARTQRRLLLEAGFARAEAFAVAGDKGTPALTRVAAENLETRLREPAVWELALRRGWADATRLEAMAAELRAWAERPDAFLLWIFCAAVGWVEQA